VWFQIIALATKYSINTLNGVFFVMPSTVGGVEGTNNAVIAVSVQGLKQDCK
jgi:hypothetical protein